jgi:cell fate (sporulation/competence/biofilm development) regulator YlbF (YheA/YmcA/DUF963 family)
MAVNLFNKVYDLEKEFRKSDEYTSLKRLFTEVNADPATKQLFNKFNNLQIELQQKQMMGQKIMQQEVEAFQKTAAVVQQNEKIAKLVEADQRVNMLIMEFNKIITKPLEEIYGSFEGR